MTFINFFYCFSEKIRLDVSSEPSARQRIHMKNLALFSSKDKSKKLKCHLLQFLFGALRVKKIKIYYTVCIKTNDRNHKDDLVNTDCYCEIIPKIMFY